MKLEFKKYPIDILLCMGCSVILIPFLVFDISDIIRAILSIPFIFFIPGYLLTFALFPNIKKDKGIDVIERIALSFGFYIAIVSLIGFILNFSPWQIRLESIFFFLLIYIICVGSIALYRWITTPTEKRFIISFTITLLKPRHRLAHAL